MNFGFRILDFGLNGDSEPRKRETAKGRFRIFAFSRPGSCPSIQNPKPRIQNWLVLALLLASCTGGGWNEDQRAVYSAMQAWSASVSKGELETLWSMLSPEAQEIYERELTGRGGVRMMVELDKAATAPGAVTAPAERSQAEARLQALPADPDKMSAKDYYVWRLKRDLTAERAANTADLFAKANIKSIEVKGDTATVHLQHGDPPAYQWKRVGGDWKFDLKPSILRELESVRRREATD